MKTARLFLIGLLTISPAVLAVPSAHAQIDEVWQDRFDGPAFYLDIPRAITVDTDGQIYLTGSGYVTHGFFTGADIMTIKYYPTGDTVWVRYFEGIVDSTANAAYDDGRSLSANELGDVFVTGRSWYGAPNSDYDIITIKYNSGGDSLWSRRWMGSAGLDDYGQVVAADEFEGAYVAGSVTGTSGLDYIVIRYDDNGDTVWTRTYNGNSNDDDSVKAMYYDPLTGCTVTGGSYTVGGGIDVTTIRYTTSGAIDWTSTYNSGADNTDIPTAITHGTAGGACVVGYSKPIAGSENGLIINYNAFGDTNWVRQLAGPTGGDDRFQDVATYNDSHFVAVGYIDRDGSGRDAVVRMYGPYGDTVWTRFYTSAGSFPDEATAVTIGRRNEIWVTGYIQPGGSSDSRQMLVMRFSVNGDPLGTWTYDTGEPNADVGVDIAYDPMITGCVYMAGNSYIDASYNDYMTFRFFGPGPPLVVSNLTNGASGSLRDKIIDANLAPGRDSIIFSVAGTISVSSTLPLIEDYAGGTVIDGYTAPGAEMGDPKIIVDGSGAGGGDGFTISSDQNIIQGLEIRDFSGAGVHILNPGRQNRLAANPIHSNGGLGIDLGPNGVTLNDPGDGDVGANDLLNYPRIDTISLVGPDSFHVAGIATPLSLVEVYLAERYVGVDTVADPSGHGEAWKLLGTDIASPGGIFSLPVVEAPYWSSVTATATDPAGNTSEFSLNRKLIPDSLIVTTYSPVHLVVIEPDSSDSIGPTFNTIGSDASYDSLTDYGLGADSIPGELDDRVVITNVQAGTYHIKVYTDPGGSGNYFMGIRVDGTNEYWGDVGIGALASAPVSNPVPPEGEPDTFGFDPDPPVRGDFDGDGFLTAVDLNALIDMLFFAAPLPNPPQLADLNCDGFPDALDLNYLIDHLFFAGPAPCF